MANVQTFEEWHKLALSIDSLDDDINNWINEPRSNSYDYEMVQAKTKYYRCLQQKNDTDGLI